MVNHHGMIRRAWGGMEYATELDKKPTRKEQKYIDNLELANVIMEIADDLYEDCQSDEYSDFNVQKNKDWLNKYVEAAYKGRK